MSAKTLQLTAAGVQLRIGPARRAWYKTQDGQLIHLPPVETKPFISGLGIISRRCEEGKPKPLDRLPDTDTGRFGQ